MSSHVHSSVRTGLAHLAFCCVCRAWHTAQPTHSSLCSLQKPRPFPLGCWELSGAGAAKHAPRTSSRPPQPGSHSHKAPDLTLPRSPDTSGLGKDLEPYLGSNKQRKHINTACLPPASLLLIQAPSTLPATSHLLLCLPLDRRAPPALERGGMSKQPVTGGPHLPAGGRRS